MTRLEKIMGLTIVAIIFFLIGQSCQGQEIEFYGLLAGNAASAAVDGMQSVRYAREVGTPWLYGKQPGQHEVRFAVTLAGEVVGAALLAKWMQHSRSRVIRKMWWLPQAFDTAGHVNGIRYNLQHP